ncbi:hypothetical protein DFP80_10296 [Marinomonas rhizomae]|uniref:Uncharacterized protein n=1 Tax=Marinomonas rhizomae TaxID=491948 RepID=A0A366JFA3_9GAMM|nr:hypothetical protein DFP80_10296 [Marinomonas rhizomae]
MGMLNKKAGGKLNQKKLHANVCRIPNAYSTKSNQCYGSLIFISLCQEGIQDRKKAFI